MPYVLETCLHEIYADKGWDLTSGENRRIPPAQRLLASQYPVFPTLSDLYLKIDKVVDRLGYEERIEMDVKAGLKTRVGSLRLGSKGLMLDTSNGVPFAQLLSRPTVLELERMGSDDEKAFVMGILMTRLYEYRLVEARAAAARQAQPGQQAQPAQTQASGLRHVLVIEEAHRLLKNVPTEVGTEEANTKGQAVETFANMLSEIRAYGQGVLIAEQIPTKLAQDAIKNTNLKVVHRIVAEDDREVLGATMNLDDGQKRYLTTLSAGQVVAYSEGADHSYLLQIPNYKDKRVKRLVADAELQREADNWRGAPPYTPALLAQHVAQGYRTSAIRDYALNMMAVADFEATLNWYFCSLIAQPRLAVYGYNELLKVMQRASQPPLPQERQAARVWCVVQAIHALFDDRGRRYRWFYNVVHEMGSQLVAAVADITARFDNQTAVLDALVAKHSPAIEQFRRRYQRNVGRAAPPYAGCVFCQARCLYRFEVEPVVTGRGLQNEFVSTIQESDNDDAMWSKLARTAQEAAHTVISEQTTEVAQRAVAVCVAAQMGPALGFAALSQRKMVRNVRTVLEG
jgi:hypothetical protein